MRFHTSLPVRDLQATVAFYRVLFDAEPVKTKADYAKFLPGDLDLNISFHESPDSVPALVGLHLGIEMPDRATLDRAHERLEHAGLISGGRETSVCCYANQDKFRVTDPSGYEWEIYELLADTELKIARNTGCCAPAGDDASAGRSAARLT